jgi:SWI/SNF-related matrix-associated actin-dependent regulator 1 of chromatin subfamily A
LSHELFPYQHAGAAFLAGRDRAALLDEMGLGKTAQAITALDMNRLQRGIVVCPAAVREVWKGEFKKFSTQQRKIIKGNSTSDLGLWLRGKADVLLLSYERATLWASKLEGDLFDFLIFDESHYMKSDEAKRTRAMLGVKCDGAGGLARWAGQVWMLSGTPMPNDPADAWPMIRFMKGTPLDKGTFVRRYFKSWHGTFSSRQTPRQDMMPELKRAFQSFSLRRTLRDAGIDLPPIWLTTQTIDGDTREICDLLMQHPGLEDAIVNAIQEGGLSFLDAEYISTLRRLIAVAKAPAFVDLMDEDLKNGMNKVVIMGWHTAGLESMHLEFALRGYDAVLLTGNTNETDRKTAVKRFQEDPNCRIFIGNIKAAGTGITLTAASEIVMFELAWAPGDNAQALKRVHRIGQTDTVRARIICLENTIDETVAEIVSRKTSSILMIEGTGVDVMEKLV